ncbi:MAG: hypothetical protein LUD77_03325 [Clostridiales bacterium]|nr:hypothetical protein [Clostridiales bacterium]
MKIRNEQQIALFKNAVAECSGYAVLVDTKTGREYDLKNNSVLTEALARLVLDYEEALELFVTRREDVGIMIELMDCLSREEKDISRKIA